MPPLLAHRLRLEPRLVDDSDCDAVVSDDGYAAESDTHDSDSDDYDIGFDSAITYMVAGHEIDVVEGSRYFAQRSQRKSKYNIFEEDLNPNAFYWTAPREFKNKYRCSRKELDAIAAEIENHPIFEENDGPGRKQVPAKHQLMVLLHYMVHNGISNKTQHREFRIVSGTTEDYRNRAKKAILCLKKKYVYWPDELEHEEIAQRYLERYNCKNCVGVGDGALSDLLFQPQCKDAGDYHGWKGQWTLTMLTISNDKGKIRYYLSGFPGCSHDNSYGGG